MSDQPKPLDSARPDLEESTNVTVSHARLVRDAAAVSREHRVREDGKEAMPHSIVVIVGLVFFVAGGVFMSAKDSIFSYKRTIRPGYVREAAEAVAAARELRAQGMSLRAIAAAMAARGMLTSGGRPYSPNAVLKMVSAL